MPTENGTFSSVIDDAVKLGGRGNASIPQLVSFARSSMREAQVKAIFYKDMVEDTIIANASPFIWTRPDHFRIMKTVYYPGVGIYPDFTTPGKAQRDKEYFFYAGPTYYVFKGVANADSIDIAYYSYFPTLPYYTAATRPAKFTLETQAWEYLDTNGDFVATLGTEAEDEAARNKVTNWLLFDWHDLILEGVLAKLFKTHGDQRSITHFSMFKSLQDDLLKGEVVEAVAH